MKDDGSLLYACAANDTELVRQRLEGAAPAQLKKSTPEHGTPLHAAALCGNTAAVDLLITAGADLEAGNVVRNNPMLACIEAGELDMARYLLERGSSPTRKGLHNRGALSLLILHSWDRDFAEHLLSLGVDVNATALDKQNLLGDAAGIDNGDAIDWLLGRGIDESFLNEALRAAIWYNAVDAVTLLLGKGADLDEMSVTAKGLSKSVYHWTATGGGREPLLRLLLAGGVDFTKAPARPISVTTGKTKLSPLDYARERLELFPDATEIAGNIAVIEGHGQ
ncbi:ankyrin repeat protein [Rhodococcus sp. LBL1]|nr:ankyrin repeat protein [Rhodococcus sp. LBL1]MDH6684418.1 ankyrin repeat protein [Rhodococcus sp. LBL2]